MPNIKDQLAEKAARVRALAQKAMDEKREFTDAEAAEVERLMPEIEDLSAKVKKAEEIQGKVKSLAAITTDDDEDPYPFAPGAKTYLDGDALGRRLLAKISAEVGAKGLVAGGAVVTDVPVSPGDPVEIAHALPTLLSVIPLARRGTPTYRYLRQTQREMNAAPVAPGATKPTSKLGVEPVDGRLRVVAHLSEPLDKFLLQDAANLSTWVQNQLGAGLQEAIQDQILHGDGTGENFAGLDHTSGVLQIDYAADKITTLAAAIARLESVGQAAAAFALSGEDWLAISTTRNASGNFDLGGAVDAARRQAWGVPVVVVPALTAGEGWCIGRGSCQLSTDEQGVTAEWGAPGDAFSRNQIVGRAEGRFALDVYAPHGVAKITLDDTGTG